tara:strand:- start:152 stop:979 length:828 start_codon:yes stop_codon:yes gene_type:complete
MANRIERRFAALGAADRPGFVTFTIAGDPDLDLSFEILQGLPAAGADVIELGIPFSDPMADGPTIQLGNLRALDAGITLAKTLDMVARFREGDDETPLVLMGYYNPIYSYGVDAFISEALRVGVDGLIVVDLPPEEDDELCRPAMNFGLNFIRLATPTTDNERLPVLLGDISGFVYYVSITGITGAAAADPDFVGREVSRVRAHTDLPIAVGFGIRAPDQAAAIGRVADGVVVGSALVNRVAEGLSEDGQPQPGVVTGVHELVRELANSIHGARS